MHLFKNQNTLSDLANFNVTLILDRERYKPMSYCNITKKEGRTTAMQSLS